MERIWIKDKEKPSLADLVKRIEDSGNLAGNDILPYISGRMYEALEALMNAGAVLYPLLSLEEIFYKDDAEFNALIKDIEGSGYIKWHIDDMIFELKDQYPLINEEDAQALLSSMLDGHDAEYGICWESIRTTAQLDKYDETHRSRMAKEFPFSLQEGEMDWLDRYMTREIWEAGKYEEFLLALTDDDYMLQMVKQFIMLEHLIDEFENHVVYYYFSLLRFATDYNFPALAMFAPHLTAMLVREIKQNGGECEI